MVEATNGGPSFVGMLAREHGRGHGRGHGQARDVGYDFSAIMRELSGREDGLSALLGHERRCDSLRFASSDHYRL